MGWLIRARDLTWVVTTAFGKGAILFDGPCIGRGAKVLTNRALVVVLLVQAAIAS